MRRWVEELRTRAASDIVVVVVGNKTDLAEQREVTEEMIEECKKVCFFFPFFFFFFFFLYVLFFDKQELNLSTFLECSAKSGQGVNEAFEEVCKQLVQQAEKQ